LSNIWLKEEINTARGERLSLSTLKPTKIFLYLIVLEQHMAYPYSLISLHFYASNYESEPCISITFTFTSKRAKCGKLLVSKTRFL